MPLRSPKDGAILVGGLLVAVGIGAWSVFSSTRKETPSTPLVETRSENFAKISREELKKLVLGVGTEEALPLIADIRPATLFAEEHIIGSRNFPLENLGDFAPNDRERAASWVIVAPDSATAEKAIALLKGKGIAEERVVALDGTFEQWKGEIGLTAGTADPTSPVDVAKVRLETPEKAKELVGKGGRWFILDIRSPDDFRREHIAGATNIPFADIETNRRLIPSSASILVYGATDRESFAGGVILFDLGFFSTITLSGGFDDWKTKGLPVMK